MGISTEVIRRITIQGSTQGVDQATASLKGLADAQGNVAIVSDTSAKRALSADAAYQRQTLSVVAGAASQAAYEKASRVATAAMNQGIITAAEHAQRMELLAQKYGQAGTFSKAFAQATSGVSGQLIAMSAGAGPVGVFLSALGPWGLAAAVAIGGLTSAFSGMIDEATRMGHSALDLRNFADSTGFSITQIRALKTSAGDLGVEGDKVQTWVERFSISLDDARKGTGALADAINRVQPGLLLQLEATKSNAAAWDVLARAYEAAGQSQQKLLRDAFGKGGVQAGLVLDATAQAGGLEQMTQKLRELGGVTEEQTRKWAEQTAHIDDLEKKTKNLMASIYTSEVLDRMEQAAKLQSDIAKALILQKSAPTSLPGVVSFDPQMQLMIAQAGAPRPYKSPASQLPGLVPAGSQYGPPTPEGIDALTGANTKLASAQEKVNLSAVQLYNNLKRATEPLGAAETIQEKWDLALQKTNADLEQHNINMLQYLRILGSSDLQKSIDVEGARNNALGASAKVTDIVKQKLDDLQKKQDELAGSGRSLTDSEVANAKRLIQAQADGTFALRAQIDAITIQTKSMGLSVGEAETYSLIQTKINENLNAGKPAMDGVSAAFLKLASGAGQAKQAQAEFAAQNKATFDLQTVFLSDIDKQIAAVQQSLHANHWKDFMDDGLAASMRLADALKTVNSAAGDFTSGFLKDLSHGVAPMDALANGARRLADSLIDAAGKKLSSLAVGGLTDALGLGAQATGPAAGATSAATILTSAGTTVAASMIAGATAAAKILGLTIPEAAATLPVAGGVTGTEVAAGGATGGAALEAGGIAAGLAASGPLIGITAAIIAAAALAESLIGKAKKEREDALALQKANAAALQLDSQIGGSASGSGSVVQHMTDVNMQVQAALAAFHGQVTAASQQLFNDEQAFFARTVKDFQDGWQGMLDQLGDNSEFDTARANIAKLAQTIQDFVNNTRDLGTADQLVKAQASGQKVLLASLQAAPALSDTATEFQRIMGTASGLSAALTTLGLSSAEAEKQISAGVTTALNALSKNFTASLTARLNVANDKSYFNDITTVLANHASDIADALSVGDPALATLVDSVFSAEAQKIVNDAGLVGDAFTDLTNQFPDLVGVVHEATAAVKDQAAAQSDLNNAAKGVVDYLNGLLSGSASTLSPQAILANAQSAYNANIGLAQSGNVDAINQFSELAENLRKAAQTMFGSSTQYQDVLNQIVNQGVGLPAVQTTTDPVVQAIRDSIIAIQATTAAVGNVLTAQQLAGLGLATDGTTGSIVTNTGNLITASQMAGLGLSLNSTTGSVATNTGALLTANQLAALGLSLDATSGQIKNTLLTQSQLASLGLATNTTVGSLLTQSQMSALGLAANTTVSGLLTAAQLAQAGLAANTTVSGLLTAAQLAQAGLATDPTLVNTNSAIGTLLTSAQLQQSGLAANTTVAGLLTAAQLAQAGLATNSVASGLLTQSQVQNLGLALNATAAGLLTQAQIAQLGLSTDGTTITWSNAIYGKTDQVAGNIVGASNNVLGAKGSIDSGNATLTAIQGLQNTASQQLALLNTQFTAHVVTFDVVQHIKNSADVTTTFSVQNNMIDALNKIAFNTYAIAQNTFTLALTQNTGSSSEPRILGKYATGGIAPPFSSFIFGEHHPQGPFFGRAGSQAIPITPSMPSVAGNDNSALLSRIDRLTSEVAELKKELRYIGNVGAAHLDVDRKGHAQTASEVGDVKKTIKAEASHDRNNPALKKAL